MSKSKWFGYWVFVTTLAVTLFTVAVSLDFGGLTTALVSLGQTPRFQALNVLGTVVTLLSGLLAVYGFYWFVIYTVYNPVYNRLPAWLYVNFRFFNPAKKEFQAHYRLVYRFHQSLLLAKVVVERYSEALQRTNDGLEVVLTDNVKEALSRAVADCYPAGDPLAFKLENALLELLTGVGSTIELSDVYRIQLWLLVTAGYEPTQAQFNSAYQYLTLKFAYLSTVHGDCCSEEEFGKVKRALRTLLPNRIANQLPFEQNGLTPAKLYHLVYSSLGENND